MGAVSPQCSPVNCDPNMECQPEYCGDDEGGSFKKRNKSYLNSALIAAARAGDAKSLEELIMKGAKLETRRPIVMISAADPDYSPGTRPLQGLTPLMHAAKVGNAECVRILVEAKANVNAVDEDGIRPIHLAAGEGNFQAAVTLLEGGANPDVVDVDNQSALDYLPKEDAGTVDVEAWRSLFKQHKQQPADDFLATFGGRLRDKSPIPTYLKEA